MAQTKADSKIATFLEDHPRMTGALFTMSILLMQAGNVAANAASSNSGP
ncbi:DUF7503 family protein [Halorussus lipolyticus]|nr:hypothetical protein [Halorussus sp. DT80]